MLIFKILTAEQWEAFQCAGMFDGAPIDLADGFIHFSTAGQVAGTLAKHFPGATGLTLAACEAETFADALRWEPARGGELFPHLYRSLRLAEVLWAEPLELDAAGTHSLPLRLARGGAA